MKQPADADRFNDYLETGALVQGEQGVNKASEAVTSTMDSEMEALITLAQHIQNAPPLQANPHFVSQLEKRLAERNVILRQQSQLETTQSFRRQRRPMVKRHALRFPFLVAALVIFVLVLSGSGLLLAVSRVTDPGNPLYSVKRWEQEVQKMGGTSPPEQARANLQVAHDQLITVRHTANQQGKNYQQELQKLRQDFSNASQTIHTVPDGKEHDQLANDLTDSQAEARHTLRNLLPHLSIKDRLATTATLGQLGEVIPTVLSAEVSLSGSSQVSATIRLQGGHFTDGAQLLLNEQVVSVKGILQGDILLFTVPWHGKQHPHTLGVLNPDGTGAETSNITVVTDKASDDDKKKHKDETPTPTGKDKNKDDNGNGNDKGNK